MESPHKDSKPRSLCVSVCVGARIREVKCLKCCWVSVVDVLDVQQREMEAVMSGL